MDKFYSTENNKGYHLFLGYGLGGSLRHICTSGIPLASCSSSWARISELIWRLDKMLSSLEDYAAKHQFHSLPRAETLSRISQDGEFSALLRSVQHFRLVL